MSGPARQKPNIMVLCDRCGRTAFGRIFLNGEKTDEKDTRGYVLEGAVIPFTPGLATELMRRGVSGMCVPCWEGKPIPSPIPKVPIYTGED